MLSKSSISHMKCLVGVKKVVDYAVKVRVASNGSGVEKNGVKMSINPFCEIATEEAVRLKEKGTVSEIVAVYVGPQSYSDVLRSALAIGADRAIHVDAPDGTEPLAVAKILAAVQKKENADLLLFGKQAIDDDCCQTPQMVAGLLNLPQATFAASITVDKEGKTATVAQEVDVGEATVSVKLPAVISADLRLNQPRYAKLPDIMKAKKKPLEALTASDLGVDIGNKIEITRWADPPTRAPGIKVPDVATLMDKLKNEAKVL